MQSNQLCDFLQRRCSRCSLDIDLQLNEKSTLLNVSTREIDMYLFRCVIRPPPHPTPPLMPGSRERCTTANVVQKACWFKYDLFYAERCIVLLTRGTRVFNNTVYGNDTSLCWDVSAAHRCFHVSAAWLHFIFNLPVINLTFCSVAAALSPLSRKLMR